MHVIDFSLAGQVAVVTAWLVEAKKGVIENLAPVLTAIFTPLFAVMLVVSATGYAIAGIDRDFDRNLLTVFTVLLLDLLVLVSMFARLGELGLTPNRVAALGLYLLLLVNLLGTAWFTGRLLAGRSPAARNDS